MNRTLALLFIGMLLISCVKSDLAGSGNDSGRVSFYLYQPDAGYGVSKAIIDDSGALHERRVPLYVTDLMGFHSSGNNHIEGTEFTYNENSRLWSNESVEWEDRIYEFYAYALSNPESPSENNGLVTLRSVGEAHPGRYIDIYQPLNYTSSEDGWADYLLSYRVEVDGTYRPLVRLEMERVTAGVELYVATPEGASVRLTQVSFTNVVRCARMSIAEHAVSTVAIEGRRNKWVIQNIDGKTQTTTYMIDEEIPVKERAEGTDRFSPDFLVMRFLTVPQDIRDDSRLSLRYEVEESMDNWVEYSAEFVLRRPELYRWDIGHRARYYIGLDTSIGLEGIIEEWNNINSLAGTFLPELEPDTE